MKKKVAVSIALALGLLAMCVWLLSGENPATDDVATDSAPVGPAPEQIETVAVAPEPAEVAVIPPEPDVAPTLIESGSITGRVFDQAKGTALEGTLITAVLNPSGEGFSAITDRRGAYKMTDLAPGAYTVTCATIPGYKLTENGRLQKTVKLLEAADFSATVNFGISHIAFLTGRVLLNGTPLPNTTMRLESEPSFQFDTITTDENGTYRVETPADYKGAFRGHLKLQNAERATPYVQARIGPEVEETVDFEFLLGTGSVEGTVLYHESDGTIRPISGKLVVTYLLLDEYSNNRENMEAFTADDGSFLVEGLRGGVINVGIYPSVRGIHRHRKTIMLAEGENAQHDFHLYDTTIHGIVENIPEFTKSVWLCAFEGEVPIPETLDLDFHAFMVSGQLAVGGVRGNDHSRGTGTIGGLPPGRYTIIASGLPTYPHSLHYQAMGDDFYRLFRAAFAYVTIPEDQSETSVELVFADEE